MEARDPSGRFADDEAAFTALFGFDLCGSLDVPLVQQVGWGKCLMWLLCFGLHTGEPDITDLAPDVVIADPNKVTPPPGKKRIYGP